MSAVRHKPLIVGLGALVLIAAATTTLLLVIKPSPRAPIAANVSRNLRACLLTTTTNATDAQTTAAVWAGLQKASATGHVNAERLPLPTNDPKAALPYFNGAVQQHCALIISVGNTMEPAVASAAAADENQRFVVVGATGSEPNMSRPNITAIPQAASDSVTSAVYARVMNAAGA
jgi:basic membrane lipoprotein Med (substrate-binding protein (PBP1-ABC) superfamily)